MKTEELKALGQNDEQIQRIHAMNGADIEKLKSDNATLNSQLTEKDRLLTAANGKLEGYDPEWKTKAAEAAKEADAKININRRKNIYRAIFFDRRTATTMIAEVNEVKNNARNKNSIHNALNTKITKNR